MWFCLILTDFRKAIGFRQPDYFEQYSRWHCKSRLINVGQYVGHTTHAPEPTCYFSALLLSRETKLTYIEWAVLNEGIERKYWLPAKWPPIPSHLPRTLTLLQHCLRSCRFQGPFLNPSCFLTSETLCITAIETQHEVSSYCKLRMCCSSSSSSTKFTLPQKFCLTMAC